MRKQFAIALLSGVVTLPTLAQTEPPADLQGLDAAPTQIIVSGRRPGPGVWKVSKGNHVMWVFGLYAPLPKKMAWDAGRVERLVAQSQVLLLPPSAEAHIGFFKGLSLLPQLPRLIGIQNNPDGATLHEVLPADVYARWTVLKAKYIGEDKDLERMRPLFAAQRLERAGRDKSNLTSGTEVRDQIRKIAMQNKLKSVGTGFEMQLDNLGQAITEFKQAQLNDVACFAKTMDSLEQDLGAMQVRADAWAKGDIGEIEKLDFTTRDDACDDAILGSSAMQNNPALRSMRERMRESWLAAAEKSLAENGSTFALLDMKDVFDPKGYLGALRAKGYTVDSPK